MNFPLNPEFTRNCWLELTTHRLLAAPLVLSIVLGPQIKREGVDVSLRAMYPYALTIFVGATIIWGARMAYESIMTELREKTWDWQRMSAMSPWSMVWGKLFGSTVFAWYIGLPCLLVILLAPTDAVQDKFHHGNGYAFFFLVTTALAAHALAFLGALRVLNNEVLANKRSSSIVVSVLLIWGIALLKPLSAKLVHWYGIELLRIDWVFLNLLFFAFWFWLCSYRLMQEALQVKTYPWAVLGFTFTLSVFWAGVSEVQTPGLNELNKIELYGYFLGGAATYYGAWTERSRLISIRRLIYIWRNGSFHEMLLDTPYFMVTALFTFLSLVCACLFYYPNGVTVLSISINSYQSGLVILFILMLRDIGLLYYFSLTTNSMRAGVTTVFYIVMLDLIFPIFTAYMSYYFFPLSPINVGNWFGVIFAVINLLIVAVLLTTRLNTLQQRLNYNIYR
jgi:hypothetical protein